MHKDWCKRVDSNYQPTVYKTVPLSICGTLAFAAGKNRKTRRTPKGTIPVVFPTVNRLSDLSCLSDLGGIIHGHMAADGGVDPPSIGSKPIVLPLY